MPDANHESGEQEHVCPEGVDPDGYGGCAYSCCSTGPCKCPPDEESPCRLPTSGPWISRRDVVALIDYYLTEFPDDAQVLGYLKQAIENGLDVWA